MGVRHSLGGRNADHDDLRCQRVFPDIVLVLTCLQASLDLVDRRPAALLAIGNWLHRFVLDQGRLHTPPAMIFENE